MVRLPFLANMFSIVDSIDLEIIFENCQYDLNLRTKSVSVKQYLQNNYYSPNVAVTLYKVSHGDRQWFV